MNRSDIIGHKRVLDRLDLMLKNRMLPQTMLFAGEEGIGKKLIALRVLMSLFCRDEKGPCRECRECREVEKGVHQDLIILEPNEKGAIPIGEAREAGTVRWMIDRLSRRSLSGRYGVVVDGIDRISKEGEIALLKTIEEPQEGSCIILLASNKSEVLPTIISRSVEINFHPLSDGDVCTVLGRLGHDEIDREHISKFAGGSVKRAVTITDRELFGEIMGLCGEISRFAGSGGVLQLDMASILKKIDGPSCITLLMGIYRNMLISAIKGVDFGDAFRLIKVHDTENIKKILKILLDLLKGITYNINIKNSLKGMLYSMDRSGTMDLSRAGSGSPLSIMNEL